MNFLPSLSYRQSAAGKLFQIVGAFATGAFLRNGRNVPVFSICLQKIRAGFALARQAIPAPCQGKRGRSGLKGKRPV
jgi:hypothetical protein